jgi:hypothetical protein
VDLARIKDSWLPALSTRAKIELLITTYNIATVWGHAAGRWGMEEICDI